MKPKIVEVDVKSPRPERTVGDAPSIGKVAKVSPEAAADLEKTDADPDELDDEKQPGEWLLKLGMISGVVLLAVVAVGLIYVSVVRKLDFGTSDPADGQAALTQSRSEDEAERQRGLGERAAIDLVRRALAVRFTSQVEQAFRLPPSVDALSAVGFLRELPERDGLVVGMEYLPAIEQQGVTLERVRVHCSRDGSEHSRDAILIEGERDDWKIDYDAFARRVTPPWESLLTEDGNEGLVRMMVQRIEAEGDSNVRYQLKSPDLVTALTGQVVAGSVAQEFMESHLEAGAETRAMTLLVEVVKPMPIAREPTLRILRVVSPSWVVLENEDAP